MAMNRRKVLAALGGITIGGGALFGTGAFDTVQAERTVSVSTATDSNANIELDVDDSSAALSTPSDDTISIDGNNLNLNGTTRINTALTLTVSSNASGTYTLDVYESSSTDTSITKASGSADTTSNGSTMQLIFNSTSGTAGTSGSATGVGSNGTVDYDLLFNTKDVSNKGNVTTPYNGTIVVKAE